MIKLILTICLIAALAYGILWSVNNFKETRTNVQCRIDYGLKGCAK